MFSFGNPSSNSLPAAVFVMVIMRKKKTKTKTFLSILWIMLQSCSPLFLGINSLSQVLLGLQLGFWISFFMKDVLDYDKNLSHHFQKIIRGYAIKEINRIQLLLLITSSLSIIIYYFSNLIAKKILSDQVELDEYFVNI